MSDPIVGYGSIGPSQYNEDNLEEYFDFVRDPKTGEVRVAPKKDKSGKAQKAANVGVAVIFKLFGL